MTKDGTVKGQRSNRPSGIIRTLPSLYGNESAGAKRYDGELHVRLNIAGYEPGGARECWDKTIRKPKFWAVCTGPVSRPPERILRRGFQGIRYTEELW